MNSLIRIHPKDDVAVALRNLLAGDTQLAGGAPLLVTETIPAGHKIALHDIEKDAQVYKYGEPIGHATAMIPKGAWVHTHNLATNLSGVQPYCFTPSAAHVSASPPGSFSGYARKNGAVGIRNWIWIIPTVGCVNQVGAALAAAARGYVRGSVDGIVAFSHPYGCSQMAEDQENTRRILAGLIGHPNAGGVLVLGLGCENTNIEVLKKYIKPHDMSRIRFLNCQDVEDEHQEGLRLLSELIDAAADDARQEVPLDKLIIGLKCGGSDGFSGITANPVIGIVSDRLIAQGGTAIMTEVPEMFGAETLLMKRCADEETFRKAVSMINDFKQFLIGCGQVISDNPSPGNKEGGITTLEEKSLGCTQKSGGMPVRDVLNYGDPVRIRRLNLLSSPSNDLVSSTALAAAGAQIVLFSTGRGTPFSSPVPTLKIASNAALAAKKANWIDFDAGRVLEDSSPDAAADALYSLLLRTVSGELLKSEKLGYHDMALFKHGVTE